VRRIKREEADGDGAKSCRKTLDRNLVLRKHSPKLKNSSAALAVALLLSAPLNAGAQFAIGDDGGGTIDIQANEQEFADDHMIARGNVRVIYKDSIIDAPMATLYKDAAGKPQRAVFTGHPRLRQGPNLIHADKLTFEMASSIIIAEGNSHSEVIPQDGSNATKASKKIESKATGKKQAASTTASSDAEGNAGKEGDIAEGESADTPKPAPLAAKETKQGQPAKQEKIITDADRQQYNRTTGQFDAKGNVRVRTGDVFVKSDALKLVYDAEQKPETALFTGNVKATQGTNCTEADIMTYFLTTKRLQATGHVKSTVVQTKQAEATKKGGPFTAFNPGGAKKPVKATGAVKPAPAADSLVSTDDLPAAQIATTGDIVANPAENEPPIVIFSDAQDYSEQTGRCTADGNVKLFYQDTVGVAPKMIMVKNVETGQTEKVLLFGRCQITQTGKRWIADRITYTVADNKVIAEGNTKAFILQNGPSNSPLAPKQGGPMFAMPKPKNVMANSLEKREPGNTKLSITKVETPK